jgi:hypothetical protein
LPHSAWATPVLIALMANAMAAKEDFLIRVMRVFSAISNPMV